MTCSPSSLLHQFPPPPVTQSLSHCHTLRFFIIAADFEASLLKNLWQQCSLADITMGLYPQWFNTKEVYSLSMKNKMAAGWWAEACSALAFSNWWLPRALGSSPESSASGQQTGEGSKEGHLPGISAGPEVVDLTAAHMPLAKMLLRGLTSLQGRLGNVVQL